MTASESLTLLLQAMQQAAFYPHAVDTIRLIHTHISVIILTGTYAYKIKKPVQFSFLDFSTLAKRRYYCQEELRLNKRFAPDLYLTVLAIYQTAQGLVLAKEAQNMQGEIIDYVIQMRQFPPDATLDQLVKHEPLPINLIQTLALQLAKIHAQAQITDPTSEFGSLITIYKPMQENFNLIRPALLNTTYLGLLQALEQWTKQCYSQLQETLLQRQQTGYIRECHGDLHLGNIALLNGIPTLFDGIEFNAALRWIDTASDLAFLLMDLNEKGAKSQAYVLLDSYLSASGDYALIQIIDFYKVYRALVRAKVHALRLAQLKIPKEQADSLQLVIDYLNLAHSFTQTRQATLLITHGLSGSGKSFSSQQLVPALGFIHIRSDIERKRLLNMSATQRPTLAQTSVVYSQAMHERTYSHLAHLAAMLLRAGYSVIVDAAFLHKAERQRFQQLAHDLTLPFGILHFTASQAQLKANIQQRLQANNDASDADLAVLHQQLAHYQPLEPDEPRLEIPFNTALPLALIQANDFKKDA